MKVKLITLAVIGLMLMSAAAFAAETSTDHFEQLGISYDHSHSVDTTTPFGAGIGADLVIYKTDSPLLREVVLENRYDIDNGEYRIFGVAKIDLWDAIKK